MTDRPRYLLDVNTLIALVDEAHVHHEIAKRWLKSPKLEWAVCPFSEAGLLRHMSRPKTGGYSMAQSLELMDKLAQRPGYRYQAIELSWKTLTKPFRQRIFGHNQITDAYLLGVAIHEEMVLVTFDKAMLHLAGEYNRHLLLLSSS